MKQKSQVLVAALVMLLVSMVLCRGIYNLWSDHTKSIAIEVASGQAFYLAQAALERAKADLMLNANRSGSWPRNYSWSVNGNTSDFGNFNANLPNVNANYSYSITCPGSCTSDNRSITAIGQIKDLINGKLLASRTMFVTMTNVNSGAGTQDRNANIVSNSWEEQ